MTKTKKAAAKTIGKKKAEVPAPIRPWQARQGDVFLMDAPPGALTKVHVEVPRKAGRIVLADGKATGHAHAIASLGAKLFAAEGVTDRILCCEAPAVLEHEEHGSIVLAAGTYLVRRQLEWADAELRQVQD